MFFESLSRYWSAELFAANVLIVLNLLGALALGMLVGYERTFNGRAAGMRTYGLVSMASTATTLVAGYAPYWYGGSAFQSAGDPTHVIQGIVTGAGFLCAGVIVRDGTTIRGLTTAASLWTVAVMGVLIGVGFYASAIALAVLCMVSMAYVHRFERKLPGRSQLDVSMTFQRAFEPELDHILSEIRRRGYDLISESLTVSYADSRQTWRFSVVALDRSRAHLPSQLTSGLIRSDGIEQFSLTPVRS